MRIVVITLICLTLVFTTTLPMQAAPTDKCCRVTIEHRDGDGHIMSITNCLWCNGRYERCVTHFPREEDMTEDELR